MFGGSNPLVRKLVPAGITRMLTWGPQPRSRAAFQPDISYRAWMAVLNGRQAGRGSAQLGPPPASQLPRWVQGLL